jgi:predicted nucleic acid-binding protein
VIRYIDTSALVKLIVDEPESERVVDLLAQWRHGGDPLVSSAIAITEMYRAAARHGATVGAAGEVLARVSLVEVSQALLVSAGQLADPELRSLDAIHVASALEVGADTFLSFDHRQISAATSAGLVPVS